MKIITATELKTKTSEALETAQREPITIEKNGRPVAVMLPQADYERLLKLENDYWLARLDAAEESGYIGAAATQAFFKEKLRENAASESDK